MKKIKGKKDTVVAFQGAPGAYSELAAKEVFPDSKTLPCASFEDLFAAVKEGRAAYAMTPIDNSIAGRVADIHRLLPHSGLSIIAEHYLRVEHCLLGTKDATLKTVNEVRSHVHALGQCRTFLRKHGFTPVVAADTAGAAAEIAKQNDASVAAIASTLAAKIYGLKVLAKNIEDANHNTTRFVVLAKKPVVPPQASPSITSFIFETKSVPAALYKAIGGFATNGINITKLESYLSGARFEVAQFYIDVEGHPSDPAFKRAFDELSFFSKKITMLGTYPRHPFRSGKHA